MPICHPETDWSCEFDETQLAQMRTDQVLAARLDLAEDFAWALLAAKTLYRIGRCPVVVRPCAARRAPELGFQVAPVGSGNWGGIIGRWAPYISGGRWYNACGCTRSDDCSCSSLSEVVLPGPVGGIESVTIDGEALPATAYRVDNGNRLVRIDGGVWPACQDMSLPSGEGVFEVAYYRGAVPNPMARAAAGLLAAEFYKACSGKACKLPYNITSLSRSGESYELEPTDFSGPTGIPQVDLLIEIMNPNKLKVPSGIAMPGMQRARVM